LKSVAEALVVVVGVVVVLELFSQTERSHCSLEYNKTRARTLRSRMSYCSSSCGGATSKHLQVSETHARTHARARTHTNHTHTHTRDTHTPHAHALLSDTNTHSAPVGASSIRVLQRLDGTCLFEQRVQNLSDVLHPALRPCRGHLRSFLRFVESES